MTTSGIAARLPVQLYIESTNRCNLKCRGCIHFRGNWEHARDISLDELRRITDQLPDLQRAVLHGIGEPLLNRQLPAMIGHLKGRGVRVVINSNGILLDAGTRQALADSGLDELRISLDAASPRGYRQMRGSDQFHRIVANLRALKALQADLQTAGPVVSLWFLGTRDNIDELPQFVRLAADMKIAEVYLQRLVYFQDDPGYGVAVAQKSLQESEPRFLELIQECRTLAGRLGIRFNASGLCRPEESLKAECREEKPWRACFRYHRLMYITAWGNVLPCCIAPFSTADYASLIMGNVFETPLEEIWNGERYVRFRDAHAGSTPPKCCRGCGVLWSL
jgi:MoaA/NifB/PqqE/SkfB family radical SAM enzyme